MVSVDLPSRKDTEENDVYNYKDKNNREVKEVDERFYEEERSSADAKFSPEKTSPGQVPKKRYSRDYDYYGREREDKRLE